MAAALRRHQEPESHTVAARHGLRIVTWTLDTLDWDADGSALSLDEVDAQLEPDSVVLMHDPIARAPRSCSPACSTASRRAAYETGPMAVRDRSQQQP